MKGRRGRVRGYSYMQRVADINRIYAEHVSSGLSNREILRRYIQPKYPVSESTLYNILKAEYKLDALRKDDYPSLFDDNQ